MCCRLQPYMIQALLPELGALCTGGRNGAALGVAELLAEARG